MTYEEIGKRLREISDLIDAAETVEEVNKLADEKRGLLERRADLEAMGQRKQTALDITAGRVQPNIVEIRKNISGGNNTMIEQQNNQELELRAFQKFVMSGGKQNSLTDIEQRALAIAGSGAVLPQEIMNKLITSGNYSDLLSRATVLNEPNSGKLYIPIASSTAASWKTENANSDGGTYEATPTLTQLELGGFELYRWSRVSAASMSRSTAEFTTMMLNLLGSEVIEAIEKSFFSGGGTTEPTGLDELSWTPDTNQILTASNVTPIAAADVAEALSLLPQKYARNAICLVNSDMAYQMSQFLGTAEYAYNMADGATRFLGKPVVVSEHMADDTVYFVDPRELYVRFSMPLTIEVDKSSGFTSASYDLRALTVVDAVWNPAACVAVGLGAAG
jgi:HK97 family phage major capsid protein